MNTPLPTRPTTTPHRARTRPRTNCLPLAGLLVAVATVLGACAQSPAAPHEFAGYEREPTPTVGDASLPAVTPDGASTLFQFKAESDHLLLVYFGYTSCPDVCPTTLFDARSAIKNLEDDADRVTLAMATVDPEVDTPEVLHGYVTTFVDDAVALRTEDDNQLRAAASAFGAEYGREEVDGESQPFHTGALYAVSDQGQLLLTWPFGVKAPEIRADLEVLLDQIDAQNTGTTP